MDIDIDLPTDFDPTKYFNTAVRASQANDGVLSKHTCGTYFQNIAVDKETGLAAIPYKEAEDLGYFKFDFLHASVIDDFQKCFKNKKEIRKLIEKEPDWSLLQDPTVVKQLWQVHKSFDVLSEMKPQSVQELADVIAIIRPGKRKLLKAYLKDRELVREELFRITEKTDFKLPHALAYALTIVIQLHLIKADVL